MRVLIQLLAFAVGCLRRLARRLGAPGSGPYIAGC